ncbi:MAG: Hsp70 family protein [Acidobacteriota bacterium]
MADAVYVGFDLGTTNSSAAVFDGERALSVPSAFGGLLTPSVVRFNAKGTAIVGSRARRFLDRDPDNTRGEFKRLMGTGSRLSFPAADLTRTPVELAALVLEVLRADVEQQVGFAPEQAVVTVPALFEVPQSAATADAARRAGLERVELLQEPVASALAAGWQADSSPGAWLVYDLGGGTFDVSLLESREGLLRIVGHHGDNFLGGRDIDRVLVDWMLERLAESEGVSLSRREPRHRGALRLMTLAAEEAKIELTRAEATSIGGGLELELDDDLIELDLSLDRDTLESLAAPLIARSLALCHELLAQHGRDANDLERVVLVGGPSVMPSVRRQVEEELAPIAGGSLDPMTLVSQGAAIYGASAGLAARTPAKTMTSGGPAASGDGASPSTDTAAKVHRLWLQFPAVTGVSTPFIIGRVTDSGGPRLTSVEVEREAGGTSWSAASWKAEVDAEGAFVVQVELQPRALNRFRLAGRDASGRRLVVHPGAIRIMHGVSLQDPPLSRTLGVALANGRVQTYFERGVPLPARRTFTHRTVEGLGAGTEDRLEIPIVQGEFERADLCRLVGSLQIDAGALAQTLPAGSEIDVTLELDRGGHLSASARVQRTDQVFEQVAHLLVPRADTETLTRSATALNQRLLELHTLLGSAVETAVSTALATLDSRLIDAQLAIEAAQGGDDDAGQRAARLLLEIDAEIDTLEELGAWPELESDARLWLASALGFVSLHGQESEKQLLENAGRGLERAIASRSHALLRQHLKVIRRIGTAARFRNPAAWDSELDRLAADADRATDPRAAQAAVTAGRAARQAGDLERLKRCVRELWTLLPATAEQRLLSHSSGIH